jgi:aminoglycoside phosphotransferase (APT) family kinase protein
VADTDNRATDNTTDAPSADETNEVQGVDVAKVTSWFEEHVERVEAPLRFDLIAGGRSNLTFSVRDQAGGHWVLRRPPLGQVLATAHDMGREHRIISALQPTDVPVPPVVGLCEDESVNGAPFYVMGYVEGVVVRDTSIAEPMSPEQRRVAGESVIDVLARIHAVDVDAVGLGDLGRKDGYIERQLKRWYGQWQKSKTRDLGVVDEVFDRLSRSIPEQQGATIVHGDYRLDNCMLGADGQIAAVLDWEICTLGDPLADVGLLLVYWGDPDTGPSAIPAAPTVLPGFPKPDELLERYVAASGREVTDIDFYVAFGYWKLACILEGVYARYVGGSMGDADQNVVAFFAQQVESLAEVARKTAGRIP